MAISTDINSSARRFFRQVSAALEMQRNVGLKPTVDRVSNFFHARRTARQRANQFQRLNLKSPQLRWILGSKMLLDPHSPGLDRDLLLDGIREPIATGYMLGTLKASDIVLEVGANIGYYALIEARLCKKIYAVEPHPGNFARLRENIALNNFDNIDTYNIAFGEIDAPAYLNCSDHSNWHSCKDANEHTTTAIKVEGLRIDSFLKGKEPPTFMKMDVEGFELQVLRGAEETLSCLNHLFLEIHGDLLSRNEIRETLDRIAAAGLRPALIAQYDRPGLSKTYAVDHLRQIYDGDRGTYELFFERP